MYHKLDRLLIGSLWTVAILLCACFWFNVRFDFNILSYAHWGYLGSAQVGTTSISDWFYISLIIFAVILIAGLYLLLQKGKPADIITVVPNIESEIISSPLITTENIRPQRPGSMLSASPVALILPSIVTPVATPSATASLETINATQAIINHAGFNLRKSPTVDGLVPDIFALGTDEVLLIGTICPAKGNIKASEGGSSKWKSESDATEFDSPAWKLMCAVEKLQVLFTETLDEIAITTRAFVIMDGGIITNYEKMNPIWDAFGISVFASVQDFQEFMRQNTNRPLPIEDTEDFEAYAEYMDTVINHFNGTL